MDLGEPAGRRKPDRAQRRQSASQGLMATSSRPSHLALSREAPFHAMTIHRPVRTAAGSVRYPPVPANVAAPESCHPRPEPSTPRLG